ILARSERFSLESQLILSDIDTERLLHERYNNSAFSGKSFIPEAFESYRTVTFSVSTEKYSNPLRYYSPFPFIPKDDEITKRCEEIFSIQTAGLAKRLLHTHTENVVVGISGGLDSTLALLVSVRAFDKIALSRKNITGITMPGFGTTGRTYNNAILLMQSLGITIREIDIRPAVELHFGDIGHDAENMDITYENSQARERTQILMDVANQVNGLVIGTGDLSELALGWATYNGDHMSMYGVNSGIPKTLVRYLVRWAANCQVDEASKNTLLDILDTPVSPELLPAGENGEIAQKTEDIVGPYELHDFFLYYMVRFGFSPSKIFFLAQEAFAGIYPLPVIAKWLKIFVRRFFAQQFKRSCMPDGPKVGSINLSPRGDWRMPSDASARIWIKEAEDISF
ncbi:MAG: NAD(+) synthase, partial [Bacteroidales bacterium]|nr:NAD(+) synthase [Bacteroidales bacterium]